ncbi:hypothetical protein KVV02_001404 [Mortierella alpina]|uniref:Cation-transporting P-type ATPase N-terminal domain-containing protein n=1 Tax=Mortierella alpina TaxID=64518 RepID=A0A9P8ABY3_MORAP|nr:hypothetical protein KVV02_001404 [Mortierella alpina]
MARGYLELHDPKDELGLNKSTTGARRPNNDGGGVELDDIFLTNPHTGLTHEQAAARLKTFGPNELVEVKKSQILKFLSYFVGPIAFLIQLACIISAIVKDWFNFFIILGLLFLNAIIGYVEEARAESAVDALRQTLALKTRCWREGHLMELDTSCLVPGDVIVLRLGDIVPADAKLLGIDASGADTDGDLLVDQSALTGESLAVRKKKGDEVYSSTVVKQGQQRAIVAKTGIKTYIGMAAHLIATTQDEGHFQKIIGRIGNFLIFFTLVLVVLIIIIQFINFRDDPVRGQVLKILGPVLILAVAAIPVGLPTVMAVTMAVGARGLAAKQVIVKRLAAVEEMSSLSILCSDKTGTLTLNELTFDEPYLCEGYSATDLLLYSYLASEFGANDPIEVAVRQAAELQVPVLRNRVATNKVPGYEISHFVPFNPSVKYTQATVRDLQQGTTFKVAKGAPQVIIKLVGGDDAAAVRAYVTMAKRGLRALGVARTVAGTDDQWTLVGLAAMLDPPRPDSAETIARCQRMGITVKMVTGDQQIIAKEVSRRLGLGRISPLPDKWRVGQLIFLSCFLGVLLTGLSFGHFFYFRNTHGYLPYPEASGDSVDRRLDSIMYLHISSAPHFLIFSTRLTGYFWESVPSLMFTGVIVGTQVIALVMVIFGWLTPAVPVGQALSVFAISFVSCVVLDFIKVQVFRLWTKGSDSLSCAPCGPRRKMLQKRRRDAAQQKRVWNNIQKTREIVLKTRVLLAIRDGGGKTPQTMHDVNWD